MALFRMFQMGSLSSASVPARYFQTTSYMLNRIQGRVKFFDTKKGFGFIQAGDKDFFVHFADIQSTTFRTLYENEEVEFEIARSDGRERAVDVTYPGNEKINRPPPRK
jgi:cold shock protein